MPQPKSFYPKDLTDQSFKVLRQLVDIVPDGILIGGWGTWVRKHGPTSHDIDLIVDHSGRDVIFALADDHSESSHLGGIKWRAEVEGIHVDLYVPRRSRLGRELKLRVAPLAAYTEEIDGWRVLDVDARTRRRSSRPSWTALNHNLARRTEVSCSRCSPTCTRRLSRVA